jgi:hypothetical protein
MPETPAVDYVLTASGNGLRVHCIWGGDRFAHRIEILKGDAWQACLESVEGDAETPWPPSAPIQELHRQDWMASDCLLGVGKAGHGHWSLSLEPLSDAVGFRFDMACRAKIDQGRSALAQTYRWIGSANDSASGELASPSVMNIPSMDGYLECRVVQGGQLRLLSDSQGVFDVELPPSDGSHTVRWIYEIRWFDRSNRS